MELKISTMIAMVLIVLLCQSQTYATEEMGITPQQFCVNHGGVSFDTKNPVVSICCYQATHRCIGTNTELKMSAYVQFPWDKNNWMTTETTRKFVNHPLWLGKIQRDGK